MVGVGDGEFLVATSRQSMAVALALVLVSGVRWMKNPSTLLSRHYGTIALLLHSFRKWPGHTLDGWHLVVGMAACFPGLY